jgi:3D (Asp-Asp-Asp) domain-containing protein
VLIPSALRADIWSLVVPSAKRQLARLVACACALLLLGVSGAVAWAAGSASPPSGGAPIGGLAPTHTPVKVPRGPGKHAHGRWLTAVTITEYWPAPEAWFVGKPVSVPGLSGKHRIDWLYSATGVSMQGDGLGLDGQMYHINSLGSGGWVTASGAPTDPSDGWAGGSPYWRAGGYWATSSGAVTFPLASGGWSAGVGRRYVSLPGVTFAPGPSLPLSFYRSIAVDPRLIPLGSRVYVPAYRNDGYGGWFVAQDTGGAITGHHIDVYRSPPSSPNDSGQYLTGQRILVLAPGR